MVTATHDAGKENTIYTHEGHTLKGTRQVAKGRGCNSIAPFGAGFCIEECVYGKGAILIHVGTTKKTTF